MIGVIFFFIYMMWRWKRTLGFQLERIEQTAVVIILAVVAAAATGGNNNVDDDCWSCTQEYYARVKHT